MFKITIKVCLRTEITIKYSENIVAPIIFSFGVRMTEQDAIRTKFRVIHSDRKE